MDRQFLIDTNIAVGYLENQLSQRWANDLSSTTIQLSVITRIELLAWPDASVQKLQILQSFIDNSFIYKLDESIIVETISIRKFFKVKLPDAIIAATAIANGLTLLTRNVSDFKKVPSLLLFDPYAD